MSYFPNIINVVKSFFKNLAIFIFPGFGSIKFVLSGTGLWTVLSSVSVPFQGRTFLRGKNFHRLDLSNFPMFTLVEILTGAISTRTQLDLFRSFGAFSRSGSSHCFSSGEKSRP